MSPKSRGRPAARGRKRSRGGPVERELRMPDRASRDARRLLGRTAVLDAETWASEWLGRVWLGAPMGSRTPEADWVLEMVGRASSSPTPAGLAAMAAIRRVAGPEEHAMLDQTLAILQESQPGPGWGDQPWRPVAAGRAVDVWASERVLIIDFDGPAPHSLMASITTVGGVTVDQLALLEAGAVERWDALRDEDEVPMPMKAAPVEEVLGDLADALRRTDLYWPRHDDPDYVALRAMAWARCRDHLPPLSGWEPAPSDAEQELLDRFFARGDLVDDEAARRVAELALDFGTGYLDGGVLTWSPGSVMQFLTDHLPRKAVLDRDERIAVPRVLRAWVRFALEERGVPQEWIVPVVAAVDEWAPEFDAAFDDSSSWGPAKQALSGLLELGVDLTDEEAVEHSIRVLNAHRLADQLRPAAGRPDA